MAVSEVVLSARNVNKRFGALAALRDVDFELRKGEVHGLVGQNGAGKSTLVGVLSGALAPDSGALQIYGASAHSLSPQDAKRAGIRVIHQERQLCPHLTVLENIHLGSLPTRWRGIVAWDAARRAARRSLAILGVDIDVDTPVADLSRADQQIVEIAKAVHEDARVLLMDEPTAALSHLESKRLLDFCARLRDSGTAIVYISHHLAEITRLADRVTVIRDGARVGTFPAADTSVDTLSHLMVGDALGPPSRPPRSPDTAGAPVLQTRRLTTEGFRELDLTVRNGEIVALTGLLGAGHFEVAMTLFGAQTVHSGEILIDGRVVRMRSPADACRLGMGFVPPDRKSQGIIRALTIAENATLPTIAKSPGAIVSRSKTLRRASEALRGLAVKAPRLSDGIETLSGGNQQKVVFGKWLGTGAHILILAEPTSGVDIRAKEEIFSIMQDVALKGGCIVLASTDFGEVARIATRALVLRKGNVVAEIHGDDISPERLFELASEA